MAAGAVSMVFHFWAWFWKASIGCQINRYIVDSCLFEKQKYGGNRRNKGVLRTDSKEAAVSDCLSSDLLTRALFTSSN